MKGLGTDLIQGLCIATSSCATHTSTRVRTAHTTALTHAGTLDTAVMMMVKERVTMAVRSVLLAVLGAAGKRQLS